MKLFPIYILLILSFAGCVSTNDFADTEVVSAAVPEPVLAIECNCGEPTIAWGQNGELLVSDGGGRILARSLDGGGSWERFSLQIRTGSELAGNQIHVQGDAQLQMDVEGAVWLSMLHWNLFGGGVRVLKTSDAGQTWDLDTFVKTQQAETGNLPDRQWLGFIEDEVLLFCICTAATLPGIFSSADGTDFQFREYVVSETPRNTPWGMPAVGPTGDIFWPFFTGNGNLQAGGAGVEAGVGVMEFISGAWSQSNPLEIGENQIVGGGFPNSALAGGRVAVAWNHVEDGVARSKISMLDDGAWDRPMTLPSVQANYPHPWVDSINDTFVMMSYGNGGSTPQVFLSFWDDQYLGMLDLGVTVGQTDLPHFAINEHGDIAATWIGKNGIMVSIIERETWEAKT